MTDKCAWQFTHRLNPPEADIVIRCPWAFARLMWHTTSKEFRGWPATLDSGIVAGWRWPWRKQFRERAWWLKREPLPVGIYGAMDETYLIRAAVEIGWQPTPEQLRTGKDRSHYIGATVRRIKQTMPHCPHVYWISDCPNCARNALALAVELLAKQEPRAIPDPHESPLAAFRRREAEAQKRLQATKAHLEASHDDKV